jgi:hypothetical protein
MAVTAPAIAAIVVLTQAHDLPGGCRQVPAIVTAASGLTVSLVAFMPEGSVSVHTGLRHTSSATPSASAWSWPAASGNSNA